MKQASGTDPMAELGVVHRDLKPCPNRPGILHALVSGSQCFNGAEYVDQVIYFAFKIYEYRSKIHEFKGKLYVYGPAVLVSVRPVLHDPSKGRRIGEAQHPGPNCTHHQLDFDDSEGSVLSDEGQDWLGGDNHGYDEEWFNECLLEKTENYADFVSAKKFSGRKVGMVFRIGEQGLGYYRDCPMKISLADAIIGNSKVPPLRLNLHGLVSNDQDCAAAATLPKVNDSQHKKRGDRGNRAKGPLSCSAKSSDGKAAKEAVESMNSRKVTWNGEQKFDDGVLAGSKGHRRNGLWAIDSANGNSWTGGSKYLETTSADIVLFQETKIRGTDAIQSAEDTALRHGWKVAIAPAASGERGGASAGVAVATRKHLGLSQPDINEDQSIASRFTLKKCGAICRGGIHIGAIYLHDVVGPTAAKNRDILERVAFHLKGLAGSWIIGGDWNCTPEELRATGWLTLVGAEVQAPKDATCHGKVYDFFVVKKDICGAIYDVRSVADGIFYPHNPVRLMLRAAPRAMRQRTLVSPGSFQAVLPFGPATLQQHCDAKAAEDIGRSVKGDPCDLQTEMDKLTDLVERQLVSIAGLEGKDATNHLGRVEGPKFVEKCPMQMASGTQRTTPALRAWKVVWKWLGNLLHQRPGSFEARRIVRRILKHNHYLGTNEDDSQFIKWRSTLSTSMLQNHLWTQMIRKVAGEMVSTLETEINDRSRADWETWIAEGPARGLSRQHKMSKTATGWIPTEKFLVDDIDEEVQVEAAETNLSWDNFQGVSPAACDVGVPGSVNQELQSQVYAWQGEWACRSDSAAMPAAEWPRDMGPPPEALQLEHFKRALLSFPAQLGLGWDKIHPRAIARLEDSILAAILRILQACEGLGDWPLRISMVIIVLLPKPAGGWRPIGLLSWMPKVWMKMRRTAAAEWEKANERAYLYAGPGKGAEIAAWKQAARAEAASACKEACYAQCLLDLVKAFDRVPHHVLIREASALGYSLWILRLSLATYTSDRILRVGGVVSTPFKARRGITAGSGLATAEMRLVMIRIVDRASQISPMVVPTLFVDDLSAEVAGGQKFVQTNVVQFTRQVCSDIERDGMEVSRTKSICTASSDTVGKEVAAELSMYGIKYASKVMSLGAALGAGVRRNATNLKARLKKFRKRIVRFRKLRRAKVDTARLLRTGATKALTYGQAVMGVSNSALLAQRRSAAAAAAPAAGSRGQCLEMALILADGSQRGRADPAFDAHTMPIGQWSQAIWHKWLPLTTLSRTVDKAKRSVRLLQPCEVWRSVCGPASAMVASAQRIGWTICDATHLITDDGESLHLCSDPPAVVEKKVIESVRRWRWQNVAEKHSHLQRGTRGVQFEPVQKTLSAKQIKGYSIETTKHIQSGLRSALANRQWPQLRCYKAGFTKHDRCLCCAERHYRSLAHNKSCSDEQLLEWLDSEEPGQLDLPVGSIEHRVWFCPTFGLERQTYGSQCMRSCINGEFSMHNEFTQAHSTGLFPAWRHPTFRTVPPPAEGSFQWVMKPPGNSFRGKFYTDGSCMDARRGELTRLGWAFVALDADDRIAAIARGVPPKWIGDIPGAEAWALFQAGSCAEPGSTFRSDCRPCVEALAEGKVAACSAKRPLARVNGMMHHAMDDVEQGAVVWMPAHTAKQCVGIKKLSDGSLLTDQDRRANDRADEQAKLATSETRAPPEIRQDFDDYRQNILDACAWLGLVTWLAGNLPGPVKRDSGASAFKALQHRGRQGALKLDRKRQPVVRLPSDGGHLLVADGKLQWCAVCGSRGSLEKIGAQRCEGTKREKWLCKSLVEGEGGTDTTAAAAGHLRMLSGQVVWCDRCGAYGTHRGCGLAHPCPGAAVMGSGGGKWQRLRLLRQGRHPKDRHWIGSPVPEAAWSLATVSNVNTALQEVRKRDQLLAQKVDHLPLNQKHPTKLELVRQRVVQKELASSGRLDNGVVCSGSSSQTPYAGLHVPKLTRFEALRLRIKAKEVKKQMGEPYGES